MLCILLLRIRRTAGKSSQFSTGCRCGVRELRAHRALLRACVDAGRSRVATEPYPVVAVHNGRTAGSLQTPDVLHG